MRISARLLFICSGGLGALFALSGAVLPAPMNRGGGGLWEVGKSASGAGSEKRCVADPALLAQWEHRSNQCTRVIISSTSDDAVIHYTCTGGGFGRSHIRVVTPRTLRIDTQGISGGLPFSYVLHARRVGSC